METSSGTPSLKRKTKNTTKSTKNNTSSTQQQEVESIGKETEKVGSINIINIINNTNNNNSINNKSNNSNNQPHEEDTSANILLALQSAASPRESPRASSPPLSSISSSSLSSLSSSSPSPSPRSPTSPHTDLLNTSGNEESEKEGKCMLGDCALCTRGVPMLLVRSPTWASIMRVVFFCLQYDKKDREFFNLKTDIYGFIISHWNKLSLNKKRSDNWHKQIQDMLSHSKNLFESGMEKYKQNGFWRMKQNHDPWTMHKPRSYNWTKRATRSLSDASSSSDSEFIHVFDLQTGAVVQEGDLESPRKKIKNDDEPMTEEKSSLEDEIKTLKEALANMSENLYSVKEELKKKDQEILEKAVSYQKTLEQLEALKLAHNEALEGSSPRQSSPRTSSSPYRGHHLSPFSSSPSPSPLHPHSLSHFPSPPPSHMHSHSPSPLSSSHPSHPSPLSSSHPSPHSIHHSHSPSFPRPLFSHSYESPSSRRFSPLPFPSPSSSSSSSPSPSPSPSSPSPLSHDLASHYPPHPHFHPLSSSPISFNPAATPYSTPVTSTSSSPSQFEFKSSKSRYH